MNSVKDDIGMVLKLLDADRLKFRIARPSGLFRRRPRSSFHPHPELFIQTGGGTDFECPAESFRLRTREVAVIPTGVPHAETPLDLKTPYGILVFMQKRDGFLLHRAFASKRGEITPGFVQAVESARGRAAFRFLEELILPVGTRHRREFQKSLLRIFLVTMLEELDHPAGESTSSSPRVAEAEKLARTLLSDSSLSVARLARMLGCSPDYLSRSFQNEREMSLSTWIARERIEMARDLLADPRHSVAEIGWMCGFSSPSYFIRVFRRQTGFTPRKWRTAATQTVATPPEASQNPKRV